MALKEMVELPRALPTCFRFMPCGKYEDIVSTTHDQSAALANQLTVMTVMKDLSSLLTSSLPVGNLYEPPNRRGSPLRTLSSRHLIVPNRHETRVLCRVGKFGHGK